jgi:hypothetical protein
MELTEPLADQIAAVLRELIEPLGVMAASARVATNPSLPDEDRRELLTAIEENAASAAELAQELSITIRADGSVELSDRVRVAS